MKLSKELKLDILKFLAFLTVGLVLAFIIPYGHMDPWGVINLRVLFLIILAVISLQFIAYLTVELWKKEGLLLLGALVGMGSSNVINGAMASITKQNPGYLDHAAAAVICGNLVMLIRNLVLVGSLSMLVLKPLLPPILSMLLAGVIVIYLELKEVNINDKNIDIDIKNPFEIKTAIKFTFIVLLTTILAFFLHKYFGDMGLYATAFISLFAAGVPVIVSAVSLAVDGHIPMSTAVIVVMISSILSTSNDFVLQLLCGAKPLALKFMKMALPIVLTGIVVLIIELAVFK